MSRKAVCPFIHNSLADTSALAWLPVFEDLGNSSPVNGVSNGSITTFLQTSPSIPAVMFSPFMSSINSSPFGQNKTCCKLNESLQTNVVGKQSRGIVYLIRIGSQKACLSRRNFFFFTSCHIYS